LCRSLDPFKNGIISEFRFLRILGAQEQLFGLYFFSPKNSFELASSVARLKDQVKVQMENYKTLDSHSKENSRKLKESKDEIDSLDRRRATLTTENQKLRELLHEARVA